MKDYEALSGKHFDRQAAEYDARDTVYYSREGKISCRDIARLMEKAGFTVTESRQIQGMIYTVTGRKGATGT